MVAWGWAGVVMALVVAALVVGGVVVAWVMVAMVVGAWEAAVKVERAMVAMVVVAPEAVGAVACSDEHMLSRKARRMPGLMSRSVDC